MGTYKLLAQFLVYVWWMNDDILINPPPWICNIAVDWFYPLFLKYVLMFDTMFVIEFNVLKNIFEYDYGFLF